MSSILEILFNLGNFVVVKQNLAKTNRGLYYSQEEWLEEFLDNKGAFYDDNESDNSENDDENATENIEAVVRRCSSK